MSQLQQPRLTKEGICFTVRVDSLDRECLITEEALQKLLELKPDAQDEADMLDVFHAFEAKINGVARRLVFARVSGSPIVLRSNTFFTPPSSK